jgi:hypothetical protein
MTAFFGEGPKFPKERGTFFRENELSPRKSSNSLRKHMFQYFWQSKPFHVHFYIGCYLSLERFWGGISIITHRKKL